PAARSLRTSATPARPNTVATSAPIAAAKVWAAAPIGPFGRNSPVASVSSMIPNSVSLATMFSIRAARPGGAAGSLLPAGLSISIASLKRGVVDVRRHHAAAHRLHQFAGGGAELRGGLGIERDHLE